MELARHESATYPTSVAATNSKASTFAPAASNTVVVCMVLRNLGKITYKFCIDLALAFIHGVTHPQIPLP